MTETRTYRVVMAILMVAVVSLNGCSEDARVARVATEAANRQARQNEEMARVTGDVTEGSRRLVEADAETRREVVKVHQDLQAERAELSDQWTNLESERQTIAQQRRTESMLVPVAQAVAAALLVALLLGFCWTLLFGLSRRDDASEDVAQLLVEELASERPTLLPAASPHSAITDQRENPSGDQPSTSDDAAVDPEL